MSGIPERVWKLKLPCHVDNAIMKHMETIIKKYKIEPKDVVEWHISRKSIDARKKDDIHYIYSIEFKIKK